MLRAILFVAVVGCLLPACAAGVLVEAEGFEDRGGWLLDPQFLDAMGSSYLIAHGLGRPVANARTVASIPQPGTYRVWVRTKDWVPSHHPGVFRLSVNGRQLAATFGNQGTGWLWQDGGTVVLPRGRVEVELRDLAGFDGRCDALYFAPEGTAAPPDDPAALASWRRGLLGLPERPPSAGRFDVVVVGGGIPGCAAALMAARLGLRGALIQNRPVLGGNASAEIGITPRGTESALVREVAGPNREAVLRAERSLDLYLGWHVFAARKRGDRIAAVVARNTATNRELSLAAPVFIDCTGTGAVGALAGADFRMGREGRAEFGENLAPETADSMHHGSTVIFATRMAAQPTRFPDVPWAEAVSRGYSDLGGQVVDQHDNVGGLTHFWEYGQALDPFRDAEAVRDHLLCAVYGTFATAKRLHPEAHANLELARVGIVPAGGESRRLMGDHILTEGDIRAGTVFPDAAAIGSGHFCLHYPGGDYDFRLGDWQWIEVPAFTIPFRCLYSRNVPNLMTAGKHISVTHIAGSCTKTMLNGGQMGVAVGAAAYLCRKHRTTPRAVGQDHIRELQEIVLGQ